MPAVFLRGGQVVGVEGSREEVVKRWREVIEADEVSDTEAFLDFMSLSGRWPDGSPQFVTIYAYEIQGVGD